MRVYGAYRHIDQEQYSFAFRIQQLYIHTFYVYNGFVAVICTI